MITKKILNNSTWRLPYYIYLTAFVVATACLLVTVRFFGFDVLSFKIPDAFRIVIAIPAILGAVGIFGLVPEQYLGKSKKAGIFRFVKSPSFRDFLIFWAIVALVQAVFYFMPTIHAPLNVLWRTVDIATSAASLLLLAVCTVLLVGLFTNRR